MSISDYLYTAEQTRALDRCAIEAHGIPGYRLMTRAAEAALRVLLDYWPDVDQLHVVCGTGNNGGDGWLVAALAHKRQIPVQVLQVGDVARMRGDALRAREDALRDGVPVVEDFDAHRFDAGVIVDALLGTGLGGDVRLDQAQMIDRLNHSGLPVLAVDVPSGLCSDTGVVLGCAIQADVTVSFIGLKRGLFTAQGPDHAGALHCNDLGVPSDVYSHVSGACARLELDALLAQLPPRSQASHKGTYGRLLVVGGDHGMGGAALLAAEAALRCGVGLCRIATRAEHTGWITARRPEVMTAAVGEGEDVSALVEASDVLVVGPGLGQSEWSLSLLRQALQAGKPLVLDADGLNGYAQCGGMGMLPPNAVITPHPAEAARLLATSTAVVQADRFAAAGLLAERCGAVAVLKGNGTVIAGAADAADADRIDLALSDYGNPGMASGGMGDVLSGVIGALLSQGCHASMAAQLGVCLHGAAADIAAEEGERGLLASDLLTPMRRLLG